MRNQIFADMAVVMTAGVAAGSGPDAALAAAPRFRPGQRRWPAHFAGLAVVIPVLARSTWHLYRRVVTP